MGEHNIVLHNVIFSTDKGLDQVLSPVSLDDMITVAISKKSYQLNILEEADPEKLKYITRRLGEVATSHTFLKVVSFGGNTIDDEGLRSIAAELPRESSLRELSIDGIYGHEGLRFLAQALENSSITSLVVDAPYGDQGVKYLCDSIVNSNIKFLYLHGGPYGDEGVEPLLSGISSGKIELQALSLFGGRLSRRTFASLFKMLKHNKSIKSLQYFPASNGDLQTLPTEWLEDCFSENSMLEEIDMRPSDFLQPVSWYTERNKICNKLGAGKLLKNSIPRNLNGENNIVNFLNELKKSSEPLRSMKLVVLGNGQIGKTTLLSAMHNILDPTLQQDASSITSTVGVEQTVFRMAEGEVSVWDFAGQMEYTATHSFFLSMEMTSMLVCFNLGLPAKDQRQQITFWLDFLNSSLALPPLEGSPKWNIILVGVREDEQHDFSLTQNALISSWKMKWPRLPIVSTLFTVSSLKSKESVQRLLDFVERECAHILDKYAAQIPVSYHNFLKSLQSLAKDHPLIHWLDLFNLVKEELNMDLGAFKTMLQYVESIGRVVWLPTGIVFADPTSAPKIAAKFVSPKDVRERLLKEETDKVQILDETEVGCLLQIDASSNKVLSHELDLIVYLKICLPLLTADSDLVLYLFPSLSTESTQFRFSLSPTHKTVAGVRLVAPHGTIFVRGFLCQFLVATFTRLNIYRDDIQTVCANGAVIECPGLFSGDLIVTIEPSDRSIVLAMNASDPDTNYIAQIFNELIQDNFSQYTGHKQETLCTECLKMAFFDGSLETSQIGALRHEAVVCSTQRHPLPEIAPIPTYLQQSEKCKAHRREFHDIFLNYRVKCEGRRAINSPSRENSGGAVERMYKALAVKKTKQGKPLFVFWDCKCLNDGRNWEMGFEHGVKNSRVIVLLMSDTTMEGIISNAAQHQDNVLIEYESALLLNKLFNVPVFPVFLAEYRQENSGQILAPFSFGHAFPDLPHKRDHSSQLFIDKISQNIPDFEKKFLGSIKETMSEIFKLQGAFMPYRTEKRGRNAKISQQDPGSARNFTPCFCTPQTSPSFFSPGFKCHSSCNYHIFLIFCILHTSHIFCACSFCSFCFIHHYHTFHHFRTVHIFCITTRPYTNLHRGTHAGPDIWPHPASGVCCHCNCRYFMDIVQTVTKYTTG